MSYETEREWFAQLEESDQIYWITINMPIRNIAKRGGEGVSDEIKDLAIELGNFIEL